ncbi:hypothetical protein DFP72DRAFT_1066377 [Ephemerocybe angulata]|uniref:RNase H type-1 domain-containing protein n=1 Tax=Ephemerocybe angulata TaxID=980116 RepID=A0A8H6M8M3_9AGAR|nr:hypothetical protein DFP72DRAFT_1066377 [Tulosesus angulatus]
MPSQSTPLNQHNLNLTPHNAMALAILRTLESIPDTETIRINLESRHIVDSLTSKLEGYEDMNWVEHDCDTVLMQSLVSVLRRRKGLTVLRTFSQGTDRDAQARAKSDAAGAQTHPPPNDEHFIDTNGSHFVVDTRLATLS